MAAGSTRGPTDRFWFAFGQLYGYYGILSAAGADFENVVTQRGLGPIYTETMKPLRAALRIQPLIISNGREDGWIMPTHLATMGFYILRVRSNLVEMRDILAVDGRRGEPRQRNGTCVPAEEADARGKLGGSRGEVKSDIEIARAARKHRLWRWARN